MILADTGTHSSQSLDIEAAYKDPRSVVVHNHASGGIQYLGLVYGGGA